MRSKVSDAKNRTFFPPTKSVAQPHAYFSSTKVGFWHWERIFPDEANGKDAVHDRPITVAYFESIRLSSHPASHKHLC